MKKLLAVLAVCLVSFGAMAEMPINLGIHGGTSSNRIKFKDLTSVRGTEANTGYMFGAFLRLNLGKLYLEPALNYSHKNSTMQANRIEPGAKRENFDLTMNSFDIPIMVGVQVFDFSAVKIRAYLGPQLSTGKIKNLKKLGDVGADKANWRGKIGLGADIWKVTFDVDYEKGFKKLSHELKAPRSFNFTLGFKII